MSQISLKSISGITSITTPAGVDNQFTLHTNNTSQALKLDSAGNIHVHNHMNTTGVTTASNFKTGTSNVHNVGIEIAGINVLGADTPIGAGSTIYNSGAAVFTGVVTATAFYGSGANLTSLPAANITGTLPAISGANLTGVLKNIVEDTSPQLGADLDCNQKGILLQDRNSGNQGAVKWGDNGEMWMFHAGSDNTNRIYSSGKEWAIWSGASNDHACFKVTASDTDPGIELYYNNTKRFETTSTGAKITGNLAFASPSQGIDFSASAHASGMQNEVLDDYERGSWTPSFYDAATGGNTFTNPSNTQASYVKVGRIVYLHLGVHGLQKSFTGSNTQIFVRGLPYRSYFQHNGHCVRVGYFGGGSLGNDDMNVYANLRQYDYYFELQKSGGAQGRYEALYWSDMHWNYYGNMTCEIVYETDQGV